MKILSWTTDRGLGLPRMSVKICFAPNSIWRSLSSAWEPTEFLILRQIATFPTKISSLSQSQSCMMSMTGQGKSQYERINRLWCISRWKNGWAGCVSLCTFHDKQTNGYNTIKFGVKRAYCMSKKKKKKSDNVFFFFMSSWSRWSLYESLVQYLILRQMRVLVSIDAPKDLPQELLLLLLFVGPRGVEQLRLALWGPHDR